MSKLNVLIAGSTGYIGIQLIKLLLKHKYTKIKIFVEIHLLVRKFHILINLYIIKNYQK